MAEFVQVQTVGGVATIRIDRPKMNAMNSRMLASLTEAAQMIAADSDVGAAVVWGGPSVFAVGGEIGGFAEVDLASIREVPRQFNEAFLAVENLPQVTVSAVNGYALGAGMDLAMATDFRVAADNAVFGHAEIRLGLIPVGGGTHRLPRLVGVTKAKEIIYSGRHVRADEALSIGLVSEVHPADETYDAAMEMAAGYASGPAALRMAKQAVMDGLTLPLAEARTREMDHWVDCFSTKDASIGVASFLEEGPGKAVFTGR